jgi:hypothetical protein
VNREHFRKAPAGWCRELRGAATGGPERKEHIIPGCLNAAVNNKTQHAQPRSADTRAGSASRGVGPVRFTQASDWFERQLVLRRQGRKLTEKHGNLDLGRGSARDKASFTALK